MRNEDMRDEAAQELEDRSLPGGTWLDYIEEAWQEVHAEEEPYDTLHVGYYEGLAEMVLRVANCQLDVIRERLAQQPGMSDVARTVASMKIDLNRRRVGP